MTVERECMHREFIAPALTAVRDRRGKDAVLQKRLGHEEETDSSLLAGETMRLGGGVDRGGEAGSNRR